MFPVYFELGGIQINPHVVFEVLAIFLAFQYFLYLRRRQADLIAPQKRLWLLVAAAFGALLGSRLLGSLEWPSTFLSGGGEMGILYYYQQKTIVGGLLGGLLVVELAKKRMGVELSSGDLMTFPLILGMAIGRIGCFLAGIEDGTYGIESNLPWALDLGDGLLRHPTALYEIIFLSVLAAIIYFLEKKGTFKNGHRFKLFMVGYLLFRLLIEWIKPVYRFEFLPFSSIQIACLLGLLYYRKFFFERIYLSNSNEPNASK